MPAAATRPCRLNAVGRLRRFAGVAALSVLLAACDRPASLTLAIALLPSEIGPYRRILDDFDSRYAVRTVLVPQQYADIRRVLAAESAAGSGTLDLVELDVYALALTAPHVRALSQDAFAAELATLIPGVRDVVENSGWRFLPHRIGWQALLYNHTVLGGAPDTWEELLDVARAHSGRIGLKGALYEGLTCEVLPLVWTGGGSGTRFDDDGARYATAILTALAPHLSPHSATFKEATIAEAMARGEIVLHLNWPFAMTQYAAQGLAPGTIRSAPLPRGPHGRSTVLGGGFMAIPLHAPNPELAADLARYLLSAAVQQRLARELGWFSGRSDVQPDDPFGVLSGYLRMRDAVRSRPERPDYARLSQLWQTTARAVLFDAQSPAAALARATAQLVEAGR